MSDILKNLDDGVLYEDPLKRPISIAFNKADRARWDDLRHEIKEINKRASISEYARRYLRMMMTDLEEIVRQKKG